MKNEKENTTIEKLKIRPTGIYVYIYGKNKPIFITNIILKKLFFHSKNYGKRNFTNIQLDTMILDFKEKK